MGRRIRRYAIATDGVEVWVDLPASASQLDIAREAARLSGKSVDEFYRKTSDYADRPGDKDGVFTRSPGRWLI